MASSFYDIQAQERRRSWFLLFLLSGLYFFAITLATIGVRMLMGMFSGMRIVRPEFGDANLPPELAHRLVLGR